MVSFSMTLSDPNPGFEVIVYLQVECHGIFDVEYRKNDTS